MQGQPDVEALLAPLLCGVSLAVDIDALPSAADLRDRLWVDVALAGDWQEQLDAMELLARLVRVDAHTAWTLLLDAPGKEAYVEDVVASRTPMRFRLAVTPEVLTNDETFATLQDLLGWSGSSRRFHTPQFDSVQDVMPALSMEDSAVLCIQIEHALPDVVTRKTVLTRLVAMAEAQRDAASRTPSDGFKWKWTHVALNSKLAVVMNEIYDFVGKLLDRDVRVAQLRISPRAAVVDGTAAASFWRRSLPANGVDALTLPSSMDVRSFQGICHAIATTPFVGVRPSITFVIDDGHIDLAVRCAWLAAAIRGGARVVLQFDGLKLPQACMFARFVAAHRNRPLAASPPNLDSLNRVAVLRGGAKVRVGAILTASGVCAGTTVCVAEVAALRVVDSISYGSHLGVQWPGAPDEMDAIGWVRKVDVVRVDELPSQDDTVLWIDHVKLSVTRRLSLDAVALFLSATNARVRRLTVDRRGNSEIDDIASCSALLDACASLERLDLSSVSLTSLDWLLGMKQPRALRQLRVLSLTGVRFKDPRRTPPQLIHALADPDHELGKSLCKLDMTWASVEPCLDQFLAMLATNTRLDKCVLLADIDRNLTRLAEFRACSFVPRVKRRCCLAFLSVFGREPKATTHQSIPFLDQHTLLRVLAFAAVGRVCDVVW